MSESSCKEKYVISEPQEKKQRVRMTTSEKKKLYMAKLTYKKEWEAKYPWVYCNDSSLGMFCGICRKWGKNPAGSRGAWTSSGITDWNHATELLKQHGDSTWHCDAAATAAKSKQIRVALLFSFMQENWLRQNKETVRYCSNCKDRFIF